jgi:hypothetical protein
MMDSLEKQRMRTDNEATKERRRRREDERRREMD